MTGIEGVAAGIGRATHAHKKGAVNKPAVMELSAHRFFIFHSQSELPEGGKRPGGTEHPVFVPWSGASSYGHSRLHASPQTLCPQTAASSRLIVVLGIFLFGL